ncbi:uncharacterized protein LOC121737943 [Aricia agestis]|uniref:uncharacterized protein LOC121737943 n=1 Tax=Aricia agestis TaxID=91739 RepID=UPI001C207097|nr:uncharacterized protein LOC121737943 [Aricia agestis]XP_041985616.1 uncharacterized protein LOC121737943 [Aricia agestis]
MTQYPLQALKRKLEDESISLPKRLKLAKNVVNSQHFATAPKERIIGDWLSSLIENRKIRSREIKEILNWTNNAESLTSDLKCKIIKVISQYLHSETLNNDDVQLVTAFIENPKISTQLTTQIDDFLFIAINLLDHLSHDDNKQLQQRIFNCIAKYYKDSKKKLEFIVKFLDGENLETIFQYLRTNRESVIDLCQSVLFPMIKRPVFASFLSNLIRKDNIDELIAERGENIQSVLKIMSAFFTFPNGRSKKDAQFLSDFIDIFVTCYKHESQLIFAFYIMATNVLNIQQSYMNPAMKMPPILFEENDDKIKRNIFLNMLGVLLHNEIDISVRLTDTLGEKIAKVEVKKTFMTFLQATMVGVLKMEGKIDKTSLQIINVALKLDPSIVEQKMDKILPYIMTAKKNNSTMNVYTETMNSLLEILFKLSRGVDFVSKMVPHLKLFLEGSNVSQFESKQKLNESIELGENCDKLKNKIITGNDILPSECVEMYGQLTSELMFRQNKELLISLQKDLEENCIMMLEEGFVSPSIITLTEVLSAILSSFLRHSRMADHTVPLNIAEEFWSIFQKAESECLQKFGECVLKLNYNPQLIMAFLQLCLGFAQLKLLNIKYSNTKVNVKEVTDILEVSDLNIILPCLKKKQWKSLESKIQEDNAILIWDNLLLIKVMAFKIMPTTENILQSISNTKTHLITQISKHINRENKYYFLREIFTDIHKSQLKELAKTIVKDFSIEIFEFGTISNKELLQSIVLEISKVLIKSMEKVTITKPVNKYMSDIAALGKENDWKQIVHNVTMENDVELMKYLEILQKIQIPYLDESFQLVAILVLMMIKKCCQTKKHKRTIDNIIHGIFELSPKYPDIYKLFSVEAIFDFNDNIILELLTLSNKASNNMFVIKCILESAVKKVKTDSDIIKNTVDILLKNHKTKSKDIELFNNSVFQISCTVLPLIAKEKRAITTSAFRSILANLQEKLNNAMLKSFKNIDFSQINIEPGNTDTRVAILNAMGAYTNTLLKCCESTDAEEIKSLDCLWSGLEFFVDNAIQAIESPDTKIQHIETSLQLLNVTLRYIKKLESHKVFGKKDELFQKIWTSIKTRLMLYNQKERKSNILEEIAVTLKFLAELSSVECFGTRFVGDLSNFAVLKKPSLILKDEEFTKSEISSRKVSKYLWLQCLKANIIAPKCVALTKLIYRATKNLCFWIQQHYEVEQDGLHQNGGNQDGDVIVNVEDSICELIKYDLDVLSEVILAAKKIPLDYKFVDAIFELLHVIHYILGSKVVDRRCIISWQAFFILFDGYSMILNNLLLSREELLEDRWPCYIQCYKTLIKCLCERTMDLDTQVTADRDIEHKIAECGYSVEKLTQSICKRKAHVSKISAYTIADICTWIEKSPPPKIIRQHLESSIALLIQVSDSTYAVAFLRRALAGSIGQMTMTNMYTMYKRYHKYVGNS